MKKLLFGLVAFLLLAGEGCMMYMTHREIGCRKLWGIDIESVPSPMPAETVPLAPHHHVQKQMKQVGQGPAVKPAPNVEVIVIPTPSPQAIKSDCSLPPACPAIKCVPIPCPALQTGG